MSGVDQLEPEESPIGKQNREDLEDFLDGELAISRLNKPDRQLLDWEEVKKELGLTDENLD